MNKIIVAVLGIFIILGSLAFYFYSSKSTTPMITENTVNNSPEPSINPTPATMDTLESSASGVNSLKAGGSSYLDPQGIFSFLYPNNYKQDLQNDGKLVRIYKQGPSQKGQTEMYDGVIVVFEAVELGEKTLSTWVDDYIKTATTDGTSQLTQPKKQFSINNYPGYTFKMRGLGEFPFYVLQKDSASKNALMITTLVEDPGNLGFQTEVNNILATLQIIK